MSSVACQLDDDRVGSVPGYLLVRVAEGMYMSITSCCCTALMPIVVGCAALCLVSMAYCRELPAWKGLIVV